MKKTLSALILALLCINLTFAASDDKRSRFIECAKQYLGVPYKYGGTSRSGMDCSGFLYVAAADAGITLPRTSSAMYSSAQRISDSERQPGDLLFFAVGSSISHVGLYLGNNQMIHCASDGSKTGVIISKLSENYWKTHYFCAGRVLPVAESTSTKPSTAPVTKPKEETKPSTTTKPSSGKTSSSNKSINKSNILFNINAYADWNFITPNQYGFWLKGGSAQMELQLNFWKINPGFMIRYTYPIQDFDSFNPQTMFTVFNMPVCLTIHVNDYVSVYGGAILTADMTKPLVQNLPGSETKISPVTFPGIAGVSFQTPKVKIGSNYYSLVQDISYTFYKPAEDYPALTLPEMLTSGLSFSTGISITLPL